MQITVELKNDLAISGELHSVDQYLNVKLNNVRVLNENKYPHMVSVASAQLLAQAPTILPTTSQWLPAASLLKPRTPF